MTSLAHDLIVAHLYLPGKVVNALLRRTRFPRHVDRGDLEGFATIGMVKAAALFDPSRNDCFEAFAYLYMRGAVIDHLRADTPTSRSQWKKYKQGDPDALLVWLTDVEAARQIAANESPVVDFIALRRLRSAFVVLDPRERLCIELHYEGMLQREIGKQLGVSESRISQIVNGALRKLRAEMAVAA